MRKITKENVKIKIQAQGNRIMSGTFTKKNGQQRTMNFRLGVHLGKVLGPSKTEAEDRSYMTVYDMQMDGYKTINLRTMSRVKISGIQYQVI